MVVQALVQLTETELVLRRLAPMVVLAPTAPCPVALVPLVAVLVTLLALVPTLEVVALVFPRFPLVQAVASSCCSPRPF